MRLSYGHYEAALLWSGCVVMGDEGDTQPMGYRQNVLRLCSLCSRVKLALHVITSLRLFLSFAHRVMLLMPSLNSQVDRYSALLDELTTVMTEIHNSFTSNEAPKQLGINVKVLRPINGRIKECTVSTLPSMESIFSDAQVEVETLLRTAVYPRFVKYQMTNSASKALSTDRGKYQGLGDCFCMTDPK